MTKPNGAIVDLRINETQRVEATPDDLRHLIAEWPTAKCGIDLTGRKSVTFYELVERKLPLCRDCIDAQHREREARRKEQA